MTKAKDREAALMRLRARDRNERLAHIEELLGTSMTGRQLALYVAKLYEISERQAYNDLAEVYAKIQEGAREDSVVKLERAIAFWDRRVQRLERRATKAFNDGKLSAAASFEAAVNYAADRKMKLLGVYAAKKLEVSGTVQVNVSIRVEAIVGILDRAGLAALAVVTQQIQAAKAKGLLKDAEEPPAQGGAS